MSGLWDGNSAEKPNHSKVEIPVHITTTTNNYPSEFRQRDSYFTPPTISVNDDAEDPAVRLERNPAAAASADENFQFLQQPSRIPIYREKSHSTNNLSDPNAQFPFERPTFRGNMYRPCQNNAQIPPADYVNAQQFNQPFMQSQYPMYWNFPPQQQQQHYSWAPRMFDYPNERFYEGEMGRPVQQQQQSYVQPEGFRTIHEDFAYPNVFEATRPQTRASRHGRVSPSVNRQNYEASMFPKSAATMDSIPVPNDRFRRESSEPPTSGYTFTTSNQQRKIDCFRTEIRILSEQVAHFTGCRHHSEFQRLQSALLKCLNVLTEQSSNADQQGKPAFNALAESVKRLIQELENKAIMYEPTNLLCPGRGTIALPYESIESSKEGDDRSRNGCSDKNEQDSSTDPFTKQLDELNAWICNELEVHIEGFKKGQMKGDRQRNYAFLQEQITKALCKCDSISGQSLSEDHRKYRKETVKRLTNMAKDLENFHGSSKSDSQTDQQTDR